MPSFYDDVPDTLKNSGNWIRWKLELNKKGKLTKVPKYPDGINNAASDNPATWSTFDRVSTTEPTKEGGIGYCFDGTGKYGIDMDGFFNPGGSVYIPFLPIAKTIESYKETSPSDVGIHVLFECDENPYPTGKTKQWFTDDSGNIVDKDTPGAIKREVGLFGVGKYFTVTGALWGADMDIVKIPASVIRTLLDPFFDGTHKIFEKPEKKEPVKTALSMDDKEIVSIASHAENGAKFTALMRGNISGYPSDSEADAALACLLVFYCRGDASQVERIMRTSGLNRDKWNRPDYLPRTIASAMDIVKDYCEPQQPPKKKPVKATNEPAPANLDNPQIVVNLPDNFIQKYIDYIHGMSDSYAEYQHGAALMLLSTAVNKRAYLPLTIGTIYPNIWAFCLGQSTISRKTTACTKLTEFIELFNQWMILSYPGSPEAFIEDLEGEQRVNGPENVGHGILCRDEAGGILSSMEKSYMADMRDLFCQLYDCRPFTRKLRTSQRKAKTTFNIKDTYLCMFFATTPDIFSTYTKLEDLTSGWLLRFLYYFPNHEHKLRDLSTMSEGDRARFNGICKHIQALITFFQKHEVEFQFSIAGLTFYNDWKNQHLNQMQRERQEDRGMFDRLSIYALKMAMLYTIGKDCMINDLKPEAPRTVKIDIDDDCLRTACEHVDQYFYPVSKIVFDHIGRNEDKNVLEKILGTVRRAGGKITRTNLMKRTHLKRKELDEGIDTLIESTEIKEFTDGEVIGYSL